MGSAEFVTFQRFSEKLNAEQLIALLDKHQIETVLEDNTSSLDSSFGGSGLGSDYAVKLRQADFEKANHILIEDSIADLDSIDKDYYLISFTDDELRDVLAHRDEWSTFDFLLAQKLLKERGSEVNQETLDQLKQQRIAELSRPEPRQTGAIVSGYVLALLGGLVAIVIGGYLFTHKKTFPNGERVLVYSESDRAHGKRIFYLGIFCAAFYIFMYSFGMAMMRNEV